MSACYQQESMSANTNLKRHSIPSKASHTTFRICNFLVVRHKRVHATMKPLWRIWQITKWKQTNNDSQLGTYKDESSRSIRGEAAAHKASALANRTLLISPPELAPAAMSRITHKVLGARRELQDTNAGLIYYNLCQCLPDRREIKENIVTFAHL